MRVDAEALGGKKLALSADELFSKEKGPETCGICATSCPTVHQISGGVEYRCPRCGPFQVTDSVWGILHGAERPEGWLQLSGWCRDEQLEGRLPRISSETLRSGKHWQQPNLTSRAMRLLRWAVDHLEEEPNDRDLVALPQDVALGGSYSPRAEDLGRLYRLLVDMGFCERHEFTVANGAMRIVNWYVTPKGRLTLERTDQETASERVFVAMWFSPEVERAWQDGIKPAIGNMGYVPVRVDEIEHTGRIDDRIMVEIRKSRFVVADFTGHRGGVYFEAGYAIGLGRDVLWTCREDQIAQLHFDIRQYNCIAWSDPAALRSKLGSRIDNIFGYGPRNGKLVVPD